MVRRVPDQITAEGYANCLKDVRLLRYRWRLHFLDRRKPCRCAASHTVLSLEPRRRPATFDPDRATVRAWLLSIVRTLAIDALRVQTPVSIDPGDVVRLRGSDVVDPEQQAIRATAAMVDTIVTIPGFVTGTWEIDRVDSEGSFVARRGS